MQKAAKPRDYLFDNYKAFLIFLVVVGHFIEPSSDNTLLLSAIKWMIVSFHMPAFIFISGYFSKRELPLKTMIQKLAIPYVACEIIYYLFYILILQKDTSLSLLRPKFSLWYLLALFVWRVITPYVKKIPHHMLLSVIAGLLIGFSTMPSNYLSIPRILVFYPFFLAGVHFDREVITRLRNRKNRIIAGIVTAICLIFIAFGPLTNYMTKIFYGRYNYEFLGQGPLEGILCRLVCYVISFAITFSLLFLISEKEQNYSYLGTQTMGIYLFHGLTYNFFKDRTNLLDNIDSFETTVILLLFCAAVTRLFALPQFTAFTAIFSNIQLSLPKAPSYLYYPNMT